MLRIRCLKKGFSLIEVLVVIGIIILLATIVIVAVSSSRQKARDARRIADINQVRIALEQYFNVSKSYPSSSPTGYCSLASQLAPYLSVLPRDPQDAGASCSATSRYEYYIERTLQPQQWLLRTTFLELPSSQKAAFASDLDGDVTATGGWGWIGGGSSVSCTFLGAVYSCPSRNCGDAANDSIYCIRS